MRPKIQTISGVRFRAGRRLPLACAGGLMPVLIAASSAFGLPSYSYVTDAPTYSGPIGTAVTVNVYLMETLGVGDTSLLSAPTTGGLTGGGAAIDVAPGSTGASQVLDNSLVPGSGFTYSTGNVIYNYLGDGNNVELSVFAPIIGTQTPVFPVAQRVLLGSVQIQVGEGTTTYDLSSIGADMIGNPNGLGADGWTTGPGSPPTDYDVSVPSEYDGADSAAASTFTVTPTPEPATLSLGSMFGLVLLRRRRTVR